MISVIVCSSLAIFFIIVYIMAATDAIYVEGDTIITVISSGIVLPIAIMIVSLFAGETVHSKEERLLKERHKVILYLEDEITLDSISDAEAYNKSVEYGNSYWCRFNKEDRSYLKIDIDEYLNKNKT